MKSISIKALILVFLIGMIFTSCQVDNKEDKLVGTWHCTNIKLKPFGYVPDRINAKIEKDSKNIEATNQKLRNSKLSIITTFNTDKTYEHKLTQDNKTLYEETGKFWVTNDTLYGKADVEEISSINNQEIVKLNSTEFIIRFKCYDDSLDIYEIVEHKKL